MKYQFLKLGRGAGKGSLLLTVSCICFYASWEETWTLFALNYLSQDMSVADRLGR